MSRIMIVDDDKQIREMLRITLERQDYEVVEASNGVEALRTFRDEEIDVVITDIVMPEKEGIETIADLRRLEPDLPIVAMSGGGRIGAHDYLNWVKCCGVEHTFTKPIDREQLLQVVEDLVGAGTC